MKPEFKVSKTNRLIELATTVFKPAGNQFEAVKTRSGEVVIGALYSTAFVLTFARENVDVYIDREGGR